MSSDKEEQLAPREAILSRVECVLWWTRYIVSFGIVSCLVAAFLTSAMCLIETWEFTTGFYRYMVDSADQGGNKDDIIRSVVRMIDYFLVSCILLIFSFGIYELFISKIDQAVKETRGKILNINSVDELKSKLMKMILVILVVKFFSLAYQDEFDDALKLAAGIALIGVMVFFTRDNNYAQRLSADSKDRVEK